MEIIRTASYDLDLSQFDLEVVILMAQSGSQFAQKQLLERFYETTKKQIDRQARARRLQAHDVADAEQEAVFAIDEAIRKYNLHQPITRMKCSFPSYLHTVVEARFKDCIKRLRRNQKHFDYVIQAKDAPAAGRHGDNPGPAQEVEDSEFAERWSRAVDSLSPKSRKLYAALLSGKQTEVIADELHISVRAVQLWKNEMIRELRAVIVD